MKWNTSLFSIFRAAIVNNLGIRVILNAHLVLGLHYSKFLWRWAM